MTQQRTIKQINVMIEQINRLLFQLWVEYIDDDHQKFEVDNYMKEK